MSEASKVRELAEYACDIFQRMKYVGQEMLKLSQDDREWVHTIVQPEYDVISPEIDALNEQLEREEIEYYGRKDSGEVRANAEVSSTGS